MIKTILFDLDGTLLPFLQDDFTGMYFPLIAQKAAHYGYEKDAFLKALWTGTKAMMKNDGSQTNRDAFWSVFSGLLGREVLALEKVFEGFYGEEFDAVKQVLAYKRDRSADLSALKARGFRTALATNPLFPPVAVQTRLSWIGLCPSDFELITTYDNSRFCKPSPGYYADILQALGESPQNCLMVGNNVAEDMCVADAGMRVFWVNEFAENAERLPTEHLPQGSLDDFFTFAKTL